MSALGTIGRSLLDGLGMFWATLWALVLGFGLSGAVQAFVSRDQMQRALGDHRPRTIAKAGFFGLVSSSCSYAASALAKALFARGADFTASIVFMFASTNLVIELGLVMWRLMGWQFALAELVGGTLMVCLLSVVLPWVFPARDQQLARQRVTAAAQPADAGHDEVGIAAVPHQASPRTLAGWADAAGYTVSDLRMLRRELFIGFLVAGFVDVAVPISFWKSLLLSNHGFVSALENALLGPLLAVISFVCSVGNVPLAAAIWSGGASFGGVVAFVFADLVTLPLLLVYRRYYGTAMAAKMLAVFWAVMSISGLATQYVFKALAILPKTAVALHGDVGRREFGWGYTTVLDVVALAVFAGLCWLHRNRRRFGTQGHEAPYANDPVCGMQVEKSHAPARATLGSGTYYFCCDHCRSAFLANPEKYSGTLQAEG